MRYFEDIANDGSVCIPLNLTSTVIPWALEGGSYENVEDGLYEDIEDGLCENIEDDLYEDVEDTPNEAPEVYLSLNIELGLVDDARFLIIFRI